MSHEDHKHDSKPEGSCGMKKPEGSHCHSGTCHQEQLQACTKEACKYMEKAKAFVQKNPIATIVVVVVVILVLAAIF